MLEKDSGALLRARVGVSVLPRTGDASKVQSDVTGAFTAEAMCDAQRSARMTLGPRS